MKPQQLVASLHEHWENKGIFHKQKIFSLIKFAILPIFSHRLDVISCLVRNHSSSFVCGDKFCGFYNCGELK